MNQPPAMSSEAYECRDSFIDSALRAIAEAFEKDGENAEVYGTHEDNETFMMHPFCWCDLDDCKWCAPENEGEEAAPNFHYKPTDIKVWWYKYIGRGVRMNRKVNFGECCVMLAECLKRKEPQ